MKIVPATLMVALVCFSLSRFSAHQANPAAPEIIFVHGDIYPGGVTSVFKLRGSDTQAMNRAQAMAVTGGKSVDRGANESMLSLKGANTRIVDLGGHFVMPGFNDAHVHLASGGFEKLNVDLVGAKSLAEMKERIAARARTAAEGEWLVGRGWDHTLWTGRTLPGRKDLDAVTGNHPAIFVPVDGHIAGANTVALKTMNITAQSPDPQGGKIDKDASGEPTGILRETAKDNVLAQLPKPTPAQPRQAPELALHDAAPPGPTPPHHTSD